MKIRQLAEASRDLEDALDYYTDASPILVVAYAHYRRSPRFWRTRLQDGDGIEKYRDVA